MPKSKVTISIDRDLINAVDQCVEQTQIGSRSALIQRALQIWLEREQHKALERKTKAYYQSLTAQERDEDRQWAQGASLQAQSLWDEE